MFADDTTVIFSEKIHKNLRALINSTLLFLCDWFVSNRISINSIKTCVVPFNFKSYVNLDNIHVNNLPVYCVSSTKFLGVYIDYNLSWKSHTNIVCNKLSQCAVMLKTCSYLLPLYVRVQIYYAFAYRFVMYGFGCWDNACLKYTSPIVILQKQLIRLILDLTRYSHCTPYAKHVGLMFLLDVYSFLLYKPAYTKYFIISVFQIHFNYFLIEFNILIALVLLVIIFLYLVVDKKYIMTTLYLHLFGYGIICLML